MAWVPFRDVPAGGVFGMTRKFELPPGRRSEAGWRTPGLDRYRKVDTTGYVIQALAPDSWHVYADNAEAVAAYEGAVLRVSRESVKVWLE